MSKLILCGTPIGNLEDLSPRAVRALRDADVIACEDTRRTRKLLAHCGISARSLISYNDANERRRVDQLIEKIRAGETVVLVSDAGMPGLSDPGYRLVTAAADASLEIEVVPGPSAAITALAISGLPPARFAFEGFLPRKRGDRRRRLEDLVDEQRTLIFYESPHRVEETLEDLADILGERPAALARELTKMYEEVRRASLPELLEQARATPARGEIVLVVGGAVGSARNVPAPEELARRARVLMDEGVDRKSALTEVARALGIPRRRVFDALVGAADDAGDNGDENGNATGDETGESV